MFPCESCETFESTFLTEHLWTNACENERLTSSLGYFLFIRQWKLYKQQIYSLIQATAITLFDIYLSRSAMHSKNVDNTLNSQQQKLK